MDHVLLNAAVSPFTQTASVALSTGFGFCKEQIKTCYFKGRKRILVAQLYNECIYICNNMRFLVQGHELLADVSF